MQQQPAKLWWTSFCLVACLGACESPRDSRNTDDELAADGGMDAGFAEVSPEPPPPMRGEQPDGPGEEPEPGEDKTSTMNPDPEPERMSPEPSPSPGTPPESMAKPRADTFGVTSQNRLIRFERASGAVQRAVAITGLGDAERIVGADVRPANGRLYALSASGKLYTVDTEIGTASLETTLRADPMDMTMPFAMLGGKRFGVDWNPVVDRLRAVSDSNENLRIDPATGNTTTDMAVARPLTAAAYTQSFASTCRTRLLVVDSMSRSLLLQDPPNNGTLTMIGSLGMESFDEISAFEIQTADDGSDRGLLAVTKGGAVQLLDVDLLTGAAENPRNLALEQDEQLVGLSAPTPAAAVAQKPGEFVGLTAGDRLITFNRGAPGKLCSSAPVSRLAAGEKLLGIDVRPADGKLYGLADSGKLYTLAVPTAQASLVTTLSADAADTSEPFSKLAGMQFGLGWNPVADRLRVLGDGGQNLRIHPATGATTTDAALSGVMNLGARQPAYTNTFGGTKSTTLYALSGAQGLVRIGGDPATGGACAPELDAGNPNCGVVRAIGPLGLMDARVHGFDIDGRTGMAWATLALGAATTSTLYTINLTTGAASLPIGVANATIGGGEALRSFTITSDPMARGLGLTSDGRVVMFNLATPSAPLADVALGGLQPGERLLGVDFRPLDGKPYAVGSSGRLYTLDWMTGTLSSVAMLAAVSGSNAMLGTLGASAYGLDFNPAADLLRLVDTDAQNRRVVPSMRDMRQAGDTFLDAALNPGDPAIVAAAYTNNFAGSTATTLYVIDSERDFVFLQGGTLGAPSPNDGTLTAIGALGVDALSDVGFDIVGGHNGLALAAIQTTRPQSELYSIDLSTGRATPYNMLDNQVGANGCAPVIGLTIDLR
jgi:Domain of unknown function (DUF4394)